MKVIPSLLRKGKGPVFLKPRTDDKRNRTQQQQDGSFPSFPYDSNNKLSAHDSTKQDPTSPLEPITPNTCVNTPDSKLESKRDPDIPTSIDTPPILPTISYPPLSEEPFDSFGHYDQVIGNNESHDPYRGIQKYYNTSPYRGERSSRNSNTSSMEESPVGITPFNPTSIYPPNQSLLGDLRSESSASSLSDDGLGALEQITLSREPDVYTDEDMEFSMVSGGDDEEDRSEIGEAQVVIANDPHLNRGEGINEVKSSQSSVSQERPQTQHPEDTNQMTQQTKTDEDETAFFSEPEYDSQAKETVDITTIYDIRKEIKITAKPHGEALDTIDENSQSSYSQFDDDESMASSYLFSLVDDDTDLLKMKRRRRMGSHRKGRRRRQQQPQGPLFSPSLMNEESPDFVVNDEPVTQVAEHTVTGSDDAYVSQGCCSLSFTQMKQDVKTTYVDAARALNQVLYAFFVEKEDIKKKI